jgi:D-2-hydroxyacid dehydrogenase (NADP+)
MHVAVGVISATDAWTLPRPYLERLRREFPQHTFLEAWDRPSLRDVLPQADVAFASLLERDQVPSLTRLRWLHVSQAGVAHLISAELSASPIIVTNSRGIRARAMAEHVIGVTLALARQLHVAQRRQVAHAWAGDEIETGGRVRTLQGRRMGIVGLGAIGTEVAQLAAAFGMSVWATRRRVTAQAPACVERVLAPEALQELLAACDVVVLAAALTPDTHQIIDAAAIAAMKPGALLVNIGRGRLLVEDAVADALRDGRLGGAALDVFVTEPLPPESDWWDLPNVIVTPHVSGAMEDYWTPVVQLFAENLRRFERGGPLVNVVDKEAGY